MAGQRTRVHGGKRRDRTSPRGETSSRPPGVTLTALGLSLPKSFFIEPERRRGGRGVWRGRWYTMNRCRVRGCVSELVRPHVAGGVGTSAVHETSASPSAPCSHPLSESRTLRLPPPAFRPASHRQRLRSPVFSDPVSGALNFLGTNSPEARQTVLKLCFPRPACRVQP